MPSISIGDVRRHGVNGVETVYRRHTNSTEVRVTVIILTTYGPCSAIDPKELVEDNSGWQL